MNPARVVEKGKSLMERGNRVGIKIRVIELVVDGEIRGLEI